MTLIINGQPRTVPDGSSLQTVVNSLCKTPELVIAELNGLIIDRPAWTATPLDATDKLELITFVGGG